MLQSFEHRSEKKTFDRNGLLELGWPIEAIHAGKSRFYDNNNSGGNLGSDGASTSSCLQRRDFAPFWAVLSNMRK